MWSESIIQKHYPGFVIYYEWWSIRVSVASAQIFLGAQVALEVLAQQCMSLVMPWSGSEPRVDPEPVWTGPRFGSKFREMAELNLRSGSVFAMLRMQPNLSELGSDRTFLGIVTCDQSSISITSKIIVSTFSHLIAQWTHWVQTNLASCFRRMSLKTSRWPE